MSSLLLERATRALLPSVRFWDGWKVRIPVNTVGLYAAVHKWDIEHNTKADIEVGTIGRHKVNLTLLVGSSLRGMFDDAAVNGTCKDGTVAILAPIISAPILASAIPADERRWTAPTMFILSETYLKRTYAWFVWSRENQPTWRVLEI